MEPDGSVLGRSRGGSGMGGVKGHWGSTRKGRMTCTGDSTCPLNDLASPRAAEVVEGHLKREAENRLAWRPCGAQSCSPGKVGAVHPSAGFAQRRSAVRGQEQRKQVLGGAQVGTSGREGSERVQRARWE